MKTSQDTTPSPFISSLENEQHHQQQQQQQQQQQALYSTVQTLLKSMQTSIVSPGSFDFYAPASSTPVLPSTTLKLNLPEHQLQQAMQITEVEGQPRPVIFQMDGFENSYRVTIEKIPRGLESSVQATTATSKTKATTEPVKGTSFMWFGTKEDARRFEQGKMEEKEDEERRRRRGVQYQHQQERLQGGRKQDDGTETMSAGLLDWVLFTTHEDSFFRRLGSTAASESHERQCAMETEEKTLLQPSAAVPGGGLPVVPVTTATAAAPPSQRQTPVMEQDTPVAAAPLSSSAQATGRTNWESIASKGEDSIISGAASSPVVETVPLNWVQQRKMERQVQEQQQQQQQQQHKERPLTRRTAENDQEELQHTRVRTWPPVQRNHEARHSHDCNKDETKSDQSQPIKTTTKTTTLSRPDGTVETKVVLQRTFLDPHHHHHHHYHHPLLRNSKMTETETTTKIVHPDGTTQETRRITRDRIEDPAIAHSHPSRHWGHRRRHSCTADDDDSTTASEQAASTGYKPGDTRKMIKERWNRAAARWNRELEGTESGTGDHQKESSATSTTWSSSSSSSSSTSLSAWSSSKTWPPQAWLRRKAQEQQDQEERERREREREP